MDFVAYFNAISILRTPFGLVNLLLPTHGAAFIARRTRLVCLLSDN